MVYKKCFLRKRNRLENFNYSQGGAYFITVCAKDHRCLFGRVDSECLAFDNDKSGVLLNDVGRIVDKTIHGIESAYKGLVELDKYVVMPNHIHFVLFLSASGVEDSISPSISQIVRHLKSIVTKQVGYSVWQKSYYDHIIRNEKDYKEIFSYGIFSFLSQIVGLVWQYCDNILLSIFIGPQAVSYFSIPMQVIGKVNSTISSGFSVLFPKFAAEKNTTVIKSIYIKSTQLSLYLSIVIFVPMAIMIKDFLAIWISSDFAEKSGFIATILAFSYIVRGAFLPYDSLLKGLGVPQYIMYITIASSFVILLCDLLLIPTLGVNGVGYSYLLSSLIGVFVIGCIWKKYIKNKNIIAYKIFLFPYLVSIGCFTIIYYLKNNIYLSIPDFISFLITGCIVFILNLIITVITIRLIDKDFIREICYPFIIKLKEKCLLKKQ